MFSAAEDKRLKFMMETEDHREEWEAKARSEERKQEDERQAEREVSARLENSKHVDSSRYITCSLCSICSRLNLWHCWFLSSTALQARRLCRTLLLCPLP